MIKPIVKHFFLLFLCVSYFQLQGIATAQQELSSAAPDTLSGSAYLLGQEIARDAAHFPGTFVTGIAFGMSLPFVGGGAAALAYQTTGESGLMGFTALLTSASLWAWSGSKLVQHQSIRIPERFHAGYNQQEWDEFRAGYVETAHTKQSANYRAGAAIGVLIPIGVIYLILSNMDLNYD